MGVSDPADCPYCCPNDGPVVTDGSCVAGQIAECAACGQCVDYVCSASCLAVPVGNTCECTQRSSLFPFCCPLSDGSGFYLSCTDGSVAGALSRNEDGVILTPSGCPLDCNCSFPDELLDCSAQSNCRGNGRCNVCTGTCDCFTGFTGQDCVNDTCICYDFKYIQQDHPYCAPVNSAKNNAAKASIGLIAGGSVGLFVLAVICGVVFLICTKAAFDAFSMHDEQVNVMENCALYEDPGLSGHSALHEPSA